MNTSTPTLGQFLLEIDKLLEAPDGTAYGDQNLNEVEGWDSLAVLGLMAIADERYGVELKPADLARCTTLTEIHALLKR